MSQVQEIKDKIEIVDIIGERIQLHRRGKNFLGLCPFHSEKTPSFNVSPELQRFICFGCKRKGDVFTFLQEFDRLTFPETLELLADKAGVELQKLKPDPQEKLRQDLFAVLEWAQKYYTYLLFEHAAGEPARQYLKDRGMTPANAKAFGLGFAPDNWEGVSKYLLKKKFSVQAIVAAGLALDGKTGRPYDRFRGRVMFPLHDHRGRVVGFSGRLLNVEAKEAKYINTPETAIYHKRHLLYGYWQNLNAIRESESVIVAEGEFDVLSSVQAHVRNIVAVKGSALTEEQIRMLARTVKTVYLALDADIAGVEATKRAIEIVQPFPVSLRVIELPGGKDPDDLARSDAAQWRESVKEHVSAFEYVLNHTLKEQDITTPEGLKAATNTMLSLLAKVEHVVERSFYLKQLSERLHVGESVLEEQWQQFQRQVQTGVLGRARTEAPVAEEAPPEKEDSLGRYWLQLAFQFPDLSTSKPEVNPAWLGELALQRLWEQWREFGEKTTPGTNDLMHFSKTVPSELQDILSDIVVRELPIPNTSAAQRELDLTATQLQQRWRKTRLQELEQQLTDLQRLPEPTEAQTRQLQAYEQELKQLLTS